MTHSQTSYPCFMVACNNKATWKALEGLTRNGDGYYCDPCKKIQAKRGLAWKGFVRLKEVIDGKTQRRH